ncbi:unnamed protein product [Amoebophrya sp. A120]|nr:unnamed protein product [Amoebophrya sp. A120]|eukprot:GSA120T00020838001.1
MQPEEKLTSTGAEKDDGVDIKIDASAAAFSSRRRSLKTTTTSFTVLNNPTSYSGAAVVVPGASITSNGSKNISAAGAGANNTTQGYYNTNPLGAVLTGASASSSSSRPPPHFSALSGRKGGSQPSSSSKAARQNTEDHDESALFIQAAAGGGAAASSSLHAAPGAAHSAFGSNPFRSPDAPGTSSSYNYNGLSSLKKSTARRFSPEDQAWCDEQTQQKLDVSQLLTALMDIHSLTPGTEEADVYQASFQQAYDGRMRLSLSALKTGLSESERVKEENKKLISQESIDSKFNRNDRLQQQEGSGNDSSPEYDFAQNSASAASSAAKKSSSWGSDFKGTRLDRGSCFGENSFGEAASPPGVVAHNNPSSLFARSVSASSGRGAAPSSHEKQHQIENEESEQLPLDIGGLNHLKQIGGKDAGNLKPAYSPPGPRTRLPAFSVLLRRGLDSLKASHRSRSGSASPDSGAVSPPASEQDHGFDPQIYRGPHNARDVLRSQYGGDGVSSVGASAQFGAGGAASSSRTGAFSSFGAGVTSSSFGPAGAPASSSSASRPFSQTSTGLLVQQNRGPAPQNLRDEHVTSLAPSLSRTNAVVFSSATETEPQHQQLHLISTSNGSVKKKNASSTSVNKTPSPPANRGFLAAAKSGFSPENPWQQGTPYSADKKLREEEAARKEAAERQDRKAADHRENNLLLRPTNFNDLLEEVPEAPPAMEDLDEAAAESSPEQKVHDHSVDFSFGGPEAVRQELLLQQPAQGEVQTITSQRHRMAGSSRTEHEDTFTATGKDDSSPDFGNGLVPNQTLKVGSATRTVVSPMRRRELGMSNSNYIDLTNSTTTSNFYGSKTSLVPPPGRPGIVQRLLQHAGGRGITGGGSSSSTSRFQFPSIHQQLRGPQEELLKSSATSVVQQYDASGQPLATPTPKSAAMRATFAKAASASGNFAAAAPGTNANLMNKNNYLHPSSSSTAVRSTSSFLAPTSKEDPEDDVEMVDATTSTTGIIAAGVGSAASSSSMAQRHQLPNSAIPPTTLQMKATNLSNQQQPPGTISSSQLPQLPPATRELSSGTSTSLKRPTPSEVVDLNYASSAIVPCSEEQPGMQWSKSDPTHDKLFDPRSLIDQFKLKNAPVGLHKNSKPFLQNSETEDQSARARKKAKAAGLSAKDVKKLEASRAKAELFGKATPGRSTKLGHIPPIVEANQELSSSVSPQATRPAGALAKVSAAPVKTMVVVPPEVVSAQPGLVVGGGGSSSSSSAKQPAYKNESAAVEPSRSAPPPVPKNKPDERLLPEDDNLHYGTIDSRKNSPEVDKNSDKRNAATTTAAADTIVAPEVEAHQAHRDRRVGGGRNQEVVVQQEDDNKPLTTRTTPVLALAKYYEPDRDYIANPRWYSPTDPVDVAIGKIPPGKIMSWRCEQYGYPIHYHIYRDKIDGSLRDFHTGRKVHFIDSTSGERVPLKDALMRPTEDFVRKYLEGRGGDEVAGVLENGAESSGKRGVGDHEEDNLYQRSSNTRQNIAKAASTRLFSNETTGGSFAVQHLSFNNVEPAPAGEHQASAFAKSPPPKRPFLAAANIGGNGSSTISQAGLPIPSGAAGLPVPGGSSCSFRNGLPDTSGSSPDLPREPSHGTTVVHLPAATSSSLVRPAGIDMTQSSPPERMVEPGGGASMSSNGDCFRILRKQPGFSGDHATSPSLAVFSTNNKYASVETSGAVNGPLPIAGAATESNDTSGNLHAASSSSLGRQPPSGGAEQSRRVPPSDSLGILSRPGAALLGGTTANSTSALVPIGSTMREGDPSAAVAGDDPPGPGADQGSAGADQIVAAEPLSGSIGSREIKQPSGGDVEMNLRAASSSSTSVNNNFYTGLPSLSLPNANGSGAGARVLPGQLLAPLSGGSVASSSSKPPLAPPNTADRMPSSALDEVLHERPRRMSSLQPVVAGNNTSGASSSSAPLVAARSASYSPTSRRNRTDADTNKEGTAFDAHAFQRGSSPPRRAHGEQNQDDGVPNQQPTTVNESTDLPRSAHLQRTNIDPNDPKYKEAFFAGAVSTGGWVPVIYEGAAAKLQGAPEQKQIQGPIVVRRPGSRALPTEEEAGEGAQNKLLPSSGIIKTETATSSTANNRDNKRVRFSEISDIRELDSHELPDFSIEGEPLVLVHNNSNGCRDTNFSNLSAIPHRRSSAAPDQHANPTAYGNCNPVPGLPVGTYWKQKEGRDTIHRFVGSNVGASEDINGTYPDNGDVYRDRIFNPNYLPLPFRASSKNASTNFALVSAGRKIKIPRGAVRDRLSTQIRHDHREKVLKSRRNRLDSGSDSEPAQQEHPMDSNNRRPRMSDVPWIRTPPHDKAYTWEEGDWLQTPEGKKPPEKPADQAKWLDKPPRAARRHLAEADELDFEYEYFVTLAYTKPGDPQPVPHASVLADSFQSCIDVSSSHVHHQQSFAQQQQQQQQQQAQNQSERPPPFEMNNQQIVPTPPSMAPSDPRNNAMIMSAYSDRSASAAVLSGKISPVRSLADRERDEAEKEQNNSQHQNASQDQQQQDENQQSSRGTDLHDQSSNMQQRSRNEDESAAFHSIVEDRSSFLRISEGEHRPKISPPTFGIAGVTAAELRAKEVSFGGDHQGAFDPHPGNNLNGHTPQFGAQHPTPQFGGLVPRGGLFDREHEHSPGPSFVPSPRGGRLPHVTSPVFVPSPKGADGARGRDAENRVFTPEDPRGSFPAHQALDPEAQRRLDAIQDILVSKGHDAEAALPLAKELLSVLRSEEEVTIENLQEAERRLQEAAEYDSNRYNFTMSLLFV